MRNIIFHEIHFKELSTNTIKKLNYDEIMFLALAEPGAMGYSNSIFLLAKHKKDIGAYFIDLSVSNMYEKIKSIFPILDEFYLHIHLKDDLKILHDWVLINMGVGNKLFVRRELFDEFKIRVTTLAVPYVYKMWSKTAYNILKGN